MTRTLIDRRRRGTAALWAAIVALVSTLSIILAGCTGPGGGGARARSPREPGISTPLIFVDAARPGALVPKAVLGHALVWSDNAQGSFDPQSRRFYPKFLEELTQEIKPGSLRFPGGMAAEVFHWQRAIGPQEARHPNASMPNGGPSDSNVGPDEIGHLLDVTGATGVGTVNFGTGTAQEAADFVAYMTGQPGSSHWADLRVKNGHRAPYDVPYWEVGNEAYLSNGEYWRSGTPVKVDGPVRRCSRPVTCLYIYGGSTRFTRQPTVGYADWSSQASVATGSARQDFFVKYPAVAADTDRVYVGGSAWTRVESLAEAGPRSRVYTIDRQTGKISFGDGRHGAIPPAGQQVTVSYVSGPHDGFLDYYKAIKAANPKIKVCASDATFDFISAMGSKLPYDCMQDHEYTTQHDVHDDLPMARYQDSMIGHADGQANTVAARQLTLRRYAKRNVPLIESEYGQLLKADPAADSTYQQSLAEALQSATQLASWIRAGIPVADRQLLAGAVTPDDGLPLKRTAAIATHGPNPVVQPSGLVFRLFAPLVGGKVVEAEVLKSPVLPNGGPTRAGALSVVAVRKSASIYLLVINRSSTENVNANLTMSGAVRNGEARYTRLNGATALSVNNFRDPNNVRVTDGKVTTSGAAVQMTWPAHSVTTLRVPVRWKPAQVGLQLDGQPKEVSPGEALEMHARIRGGDRSMTVRLTPSLPDGWRATPSAATVRVAPHKVATTSFRISVPAAASSESYQLSAVLRSRSGAIVRVSTIKVSVPKPR